MDVLGFGALNCDKMHRVDSIALPGQEVGVISTVLQPGGSAPNTIVGLARLGVRTGIIGVVGNDAEGAALLSDLKKENVDIEGIEVAHGKTGTALIFIDNFGERAIYILPGVNDDYFTNNYDRTKRVKLLHLCSFGNIKQLKMQTHFVQALKNPQLKITFSPGNIYSSFGLDKLKPLVELSHIVFLNKYETELLTGKDVREGALSLVNLGAHIVAVTLGDEGCFIAKNENTYEVSACKSTVVDTIGAGDAFAAGFIYADLMEKDTYTCGIYGNLFASMAISAFGSRRGLLRSLENLRRYLPS